MIGRIIRVDWPIRMLTFSFLDVEAASPLVIAHYSESIQLLVKIFNGLTCFMELVLCIFIELSHLLFVKYATCYTAILW